MARILEGNVFEFRGEYFDTYKEGVVGIINLKSSVFDMALDLPLKESFFNRIRTAYKMPDIKILLLLSGPSTMGEDQYLEFEKLLRQSSDSQIKLTREENALAQFIRLIYESEKLVITTGRGSVISSFLGAILAGDYRIISQNTRFPLIHNTHETAPLGGIGYFLPRYLGMVKAREILLRTEPLEANEARELGLVDEIVPDDKFEQKCMDAAIKLSNFPQASVRLLKRIIKGNMKELEDYFKMESDLTRMATETF